LQLLLTSLHKAERFVQQDFGASKIQALSFFLQDVFQVVTERALVQNYLLIACLALLVSTASHMRLVTPTIRTALIKNSRLQLA